MVNWHRDDPSGGSTGLGRRRKSGRVGPGRGVPTPSARTDRPRILFVNQYYWPDHASTAQHLTDLAESLAGRGYDCHVLCGRGAYLGQGGSLPAREERNGVTIHRVTSTSLGRRSTLARMTDYLSYYARALVKSLTLPRFDAVVTLTTPPIVGLTGTLLKTFKRSKHIYWSMDLHPDASFALEKMSPRGLVGRSMGGLSDFVYRRADQVVTLGPYMNARIKAKGVPDERLIMVPVWSRQDEIYPLPRDGHPLRAELGLADRFVVMYSGNLGLAHTFDEFMEAARRLKDRSDIVFLFVGGGPRLGEVRAAKADGQLDNVRIMDYFPREQLHASLSTADLHLISMRPEMTGIVVPGKLYGVMASARPILFVGPERCETADAIRSAECGYTLPMGEVEPLVRTIEALAADPALCRRLGDRGRSAFLQLYEREVCCRIWGALLDRLTRRLPVREAIAEPIVA